MGVPPHWVPALCGGYSFANRPASSASMSALKFRRCVYARKSPPTPDFSQVYRKNLEHDRCSLIPDPTPGEQGEVGKVLDVLCIFQISRNDIGSVPQPVQVIHHGIIVGDFTNIINRLPCVSFCLETQEIGKRRLSPFNLRGKSSFFSRIQKQPLSRQRRCMDKSPRARCQT